MESGVGWKIAQLNKGAGQMSNHAKHGVSGDGGQLPGNEWVSQLSEARLRVEALRDELSMTMPLAEELSDLLHLERERSTRLLTAISEQHVRESAAAHDLESERDARTDELARFELATARSEELLAAMTEKCRVATERADDLRSLLDVQDAGGL
jgi:hypothetical protein